MKVDSGAARGFMDRKMLPFLATTQTGGSRAKEKFVSASGGIIQDEGSSRIPFTTDKGERRSIIMKRGQLRSGTCLAAVSEIADRGQTIIFTKSGGHIISDPNGEIARTAIGMSKRTTEF